MHTLLGMDKDPARFILSHRPVKRHTYIKNLSDYGSAGKQYQVSLRMTCDHELTCRPKTDKKENLDVTLHSLELKL